MAKTGEAPIRVHVHGLRNETAAFEGGFGELLVGGLAGPSYAGDEDAVLLTFEGQDQKTGKVVDIEIAVPRGQVRELVARIVDRADISDS